MKKGHIMSVVKLNSVRGYGIGEDLIKLNPRPIIAKRNPKDSDKAPIATVWINTSEGNAYIMTKQSGGVNEWAILALGDLKSVSGANAADDITIDSKVFKAVFTDLAIAQNVATNLTINNNKLLTVTSGLDLTVSFSGAGSVDMSTSSILQNAVGKIVVVVNNSNLAAFNGEIIVTGKILD
jgi:hypothetical protein